MLLMAPEKSNHTPIESPPSPPGLTVAQRMIPEGPGSSEMVLLHTRFEKSAAELVVANKELVFQHGEKGKRAAELVVANKELDFQAGEKGKRAAELVLANKELVFQNAEKEKRAAELVLANKELVFQNEEKEKRAAELVHALDDAQAANRAKCTFLANMSHELRTPMTVILGMTELALVNADARQQELLAMVLKSSQQLNTLISDLIDLTALEDERLVLKEQNFSLAQVLFDSLQAHQGAALGKGLQLSQEMAPEFPALVCGDAGRLKQILKTFIGNAVKFSERGKITVCAQPLADDGHSLLLRLAVTDQGIGISPAQQALLFKVFVQLDGSSTRKHEGTGLGLGLCSRLAQLMGGETGVYSIPGGGSTFWATIRLRRVRTGSATLGTTVQVKPGMPPRY